LDGITPSYRTNHYRNPDLEIGQAEYHDDALEFLQGFHEDSIFLADDDLINTSLATDIWDGFMTNM
jgi:hypothetical protein